MNLVQHIRKDENGNWNLISNGKSIILPEKLALLIHGMLEWEDNRANEEIAEILRKINCHKTVLYLANLISHDEFISDPKLNNTSNFNFQEKVSQISTKEFSPTKNKTELYELAKLSCKYGKVYIGQIFNTELGHSFIVGRTKDDEFICFDKAGFVENPAKNNKDFKFRVYELSKLLESEAYQNAEWRFVPIEKI